jgi:hypothetical protein
LANRRGGAGVEAGVAIQRAVELAAPETLVDVARNGGDAVGRLVLLEGLAHRGQLGVTDEDR